MRGRWAVDLGAEFAAAGAMATAQLAAAAMGACAVFSLPADCAPSSATLLERLRARALIPGADEASSRAEARAAAVTAAAAAEAARVLALSSVEDDDGRTFGGVFGAIV